MTGAEQVNTGQTAEMECLPLGCGYAGYEFGAGYLDSECFGGQLYDMDACDGHGNLYEPLCYYACPACRPLDAMLDYAESNNDDLDSVRPLYSAWHLVMDIRRNRGMKSISFAGFLLVFWRKRLREYGLRFCLSDLWWLIRRRWS